MLFCSVPVHGFPGFHWKTHPLESPTQFALSVETSTSPLRCHFSPFDTMTAAGLLAALLALCPIATLSCCPGSCAPIEPPSNRTARLLRSRRAGHSWLSTPHWPAGARPRQECRRTLPLRQSCLHRTAMAGDFSGRIASESRPSTRPNAPIARWPASTRNWAMNWSCCP